MTWVWWTLGWVWWTLGAVVVLTALLLWFDTAGYNRKEW